MNSLQTFFLDINALKLKVANHTKRIAAICTMHKIIPIATTHAGILTELENILLPGIPHPTTHEARILALEAVPPIFS